MQEIGHALISLSSQMPQNRGLFTKMKEFHDIFAMDFDVPVSKVVQHCHSNLPDNLWQAIADHFYWHAQQMP
jgi:hypothetical protein